MTPVLIAKPASQELEAAIRWYEQLQVGLGAEFHAETKAGPERISEHPEIGFTRSDPLPTRQLLLQRCPYKIVYRVRADNLYVVAIAHTSRRPGYWKGR